VVRSARRLVVILVLVAAAAIVVGCGESDEEKAQAQVCDARADIRKEVDALRGLTLSTASLDDVRARVSAIRDGLRRIADAQGTLSDDRRAQVQGATESFTASVSEIVRGLGGSLSLSEAGTQLQAAAKQLGTAYSQSLGRIDCDDA
jgi:hypothetical protein